MVMVQMEGVYSIESLCNYWEKVVISFQYNYQTQTVCKITGARLSISIFQFSFSQIPNKMVQFTAAAAATAVIFKKVDLKIFAHVSLHACKQWNTMNVKWRVIIIWCRQVPIFWNSNENFWRATRKENIFIVPHSIHIFFFLLAERVMALLLFGV